MRRVRLLLVGLAAPIGAAAARSTPAPPASPVSCDRAIDRTKFPYLGSRSSPYRLVLGVLSVPPAHSVQGAFPTPSPRWRYFRKAGLVVGGGHGAPITVSVPSAWRSRVGIQWGNSGVRSSLRIARCQTPSDVGSAFAGGFYLRSRTACVPLVFHVGRRTETVRFGIGRTCPSETWPAAWPRDMYPGANP